MSKEFHAIVLWTANQNLLHEVYEYFKNDLKYIQEYKADQYIRFNIVKQIYKNDLSFNHSKINIDSNIIVCIVEVYKVYSNIDNRINCNTCIVNFKNLKRKKYSYLDFHSSDNQEEFQDIINVFKFL